jgi:hypothetical protein
MVMYTTFVKTEVGRWQLTKEPRRILEDTSLDMMAMVYSNRRMNSPVGITIWVWLDKKKFGFGNRHGQETFLFSMVSS